MRKFIAILIVAVIAVFSISPGCFAGMREIQLNDGSVITGEVLSYTNGVYTIKSEALGVLSINDSQVRSITSKGGTRNSTATQTNASQNISSQRKDMEQKMMSDPEIINEILSLKDDPEIKKILQDPDIIQAVNDNDIQKLASNPKFLSLMNNPKVQEIERKISR